MKRCPFCHHPNATVQSDADGARPGRWEWVECNSCGARGPSVRVDQHRPGQYARDEWNKAGLPSADLAVLETSP